MFINTDGCQDGLQLPGLLPSVRCFWALDPGPACHESSAFRPNDVNPGRLPRRVFAVQAAGGCSKGMGGWEGVVKKRLYDQPMY